MEVSIQMEPAGESPLLASCTSRTVSGSGRQVMTRSAPASRSSIPVGATAPASTQAARAPRLRLPTRTSNLPLRARFLAMPPPMRPTPMHAIVRIILMPLSAREPIEPFRPPIGSRA